MENDVECKECGWSGGYSDALLKDSEGNTMECCHGVFGHICPKCGADLIDVHTGAVLCTPRNSDCEECSPPAA